VPSHGVSLKLIINVGRSVGLIWPIYLNFRQTTSSPTTSQ